MCVGGGVNSSKRNLVCRLNELVWHRLLMWQSSRHSAAATRFWPLTLFLIPRRKLFFFFFFSLSHWHYDKILGLDSNLSLWPHGRNVHEFPIIYHHEDKIPGITWEMSRRPLGNLKDRKTSSSLNQKVSQQERTSTWFLFSHMPIRGHGSHLPPSNDYDISWRTHDDEVLFITGAEKLVADSWQQRRIPEMFSQFKLWFRALSGLWKFQRNVV